MKTPKLLHLVALIVVAVTLLITPTPAEALVASGPSFVLTSPTTYLGWLGDFTNVEVFLELCDGRSLHTSYDAEPFSGNVGTTIKEFMALFLQVVVENGQQKVIKAQWITGCSGECGCDISSPKKVSHCAGFSMPRRVPRSPAVPISFKGPGTITSAEMYVKDLGYSLYLWLYRYDWGSGRWYGFLNTLNLPLGMHHGRVTTYVDGLRGGGCATGGFKVVEK